MKYSVSRVLLITAACGSFQCGVSSVALSADLIVPSGESVNLTRSLRPQNNLHNQRRGKKQTDASKQVDESMIINPNIMIVSSPDQLPSQIHLTDQPNQKSPATTNVQNNNMSATTLADSMVFADNSVSLETSALTAQGLSNQSNEHILKNTQLDSTKAITLTNFLKLPSAQEANEILELAELREKSKPAEGKTFNDSDAPQTSYFVKYANLTDEEFNFKKLSARLVQRMFEFRRKQNITQKLSEFIEGHSYYPANSESITIQPYSKSPHVDLNPVFACLMDNFLNSTESEQDKLRRIIGITDFFDNSIENHIKLINDGTQVLNDCKIASAQALHQNTRTQTQEQNHTLATRYSQMLFHMSIAYDYISGAKDAISTFTKTIENHNPSNVLSNLKSCYIQTQKTAEDSIGYLKTSISYMEALLHALYPYHRPANAENLLCAVIRYFSFNAITSDASNKRYAITQISKIPAEIQIRKSHNQESPYKDLVEKFDTAIFRMLSDSIALSEAIEQNRIIFNTSADEMKAGSAVDSTEKESTSITEETKTL